MSEFVEYRYEKGINNVNSRAEQGWRVVQIIGERKTNLGGNDATLFLLGRARTEGER